MFYKIRYIILFFIAMFITGLYPIFADVQSKKSNVIQKIQELEVSSGGRIGVSAINTGNNQRIQYRAEERFPFCSTGKVLVVSTILKKSMSDKQLLKSKIFYKQKDLMTYSPITKNNLSKGMTVAGLCDATIRYSDNVACNLLIKKLGGLNEVNQFAQSVGDKAFRLDRLEPELNSAIPGDLRDTTTPLAMSEDLQKIIFGKTLMAPERELLLQWLRYNTTGDKRIRAGVPSGWSVSDKTGTGYYGTTNDIGVIWPPKCPPIIVAIYYTQNKKNDLPRDDVIAKVTRILVNSFSENDNCLKPHL